MTKSWISKIKGVGWTTERELLQDKELYERQIKIVDAQIDGLVCDLYGLTGEVIKVVEGSC